MSQTRSRALRTCWQEPGPENSSLSLSLSSRERTNWSSLPLAGFAAQGSVRALGGYQPPPPPPLPAPCMARKGIHRPLRPAAPQSTDRLGLGPQSAATGPSRARGLDRACVPPTKIAPACRPERLWLRIQKNSCLRAPDRAPSAATSRPRSLDSDNRCGGRAASDSEQRLPPGHGLASPPCAVGRAQHRLGVSGRRPAPAPNPSHPPVAWLPRSGSRSEFEREYQRELGPGGPAAAATEAPRLGRGLQTEPRVRT